MPEGRRFIMMVANSTQEQCRDMGEQMIALADSPRDDQWRAQMAKALEAFPEEPESKDRLEVPKTPDKTDSEAMAELRLSPLLRASVLASGWAAPLIKAPPGTQVEDADALPIVEAAARSVGAGDLAHASQVLVAHTFILDAAFTEMLRRAGAGANGGDNRDAFESYMKLALKAQSNCRATIEALARLHQPREQVVRHVHVYEGGQAVVADEFHHHHAGGSPNNARIDHQPHGKRARRAALSGSEPLGQPVSVPGNARQEKVQNARRPKPRGAQG